MVTHDPTVADTAHRKISMRDGQIVADETPGRRVADERASTTSSAWPGRVSRPARCGRC